MEFTYNASAVAAGGVIRKSDGSTVVIPSLAPVALSPSGGEGITTVTDFTSPTLSCSSAYTRVYGRQTGEKEYTTETEVIITNLQVLDVLTISMLRASVKSTRVVEETPGDDDHEFDVDASYQGVMLKTASQWCEIAPRIDMSIKNLKRYQQVENLIPDRNTVAQELVNQSEKKLRAVFDTTDLDTLKDHFASKRPLLGALVDEVRPNVESREMALIHRHHNKLVIPGIGAVKFGELMLKPGRRRVNLLRFSFDPNELASPVPQPESISEYSGGSLTIASVEGNGSPLWP